MVLKAIRDGFLTTHLAMWKEVDNWPKTQSGLPSTAGTTASVAFIRKGKLYTGHVGDSRIVLGCSEPDNESWQAESLTIDHKPESPEERKRILESGGLVMNKSGVDRVVWKRPRPGHQGPVLRNTDCDEVPFLAVARSLGDLWSYDYFQQEFVVSPEPDLGVMTLDLKKDKCLILASDGLWNIMSPQDAIHLVQEVENENVKLITKFGVSEHLHLTLCNPSKVLVDCALERWNQLRTRADNTSVVAIMLDLTASPEVEILREQLILKMNYPRSLPVWDVSRRPKSSVSVKADESNSSSEGTLAVDENVENKMGTRRYCWVVKKWTAIPYSSEMSQSNSERNDLCGYLQMAARLLAEKDDTNKNGDSQNDIERHSNSPLQSCSNLLPEYFLPGSSKKRTESEGIENSPCPFPRWGESASGHTSLSKLATWSKVVSRRRMSDPFPHRSFEFGHTSSDDGYSLSDDENCIRNCESSARDDEIYFDNDSNPSGVSNHGKMYDLSDSISDENILRRALDHVCDVKHAVKRKYPTSEMCQTVVSHSQQVSKIDGVTSQKRKLDLLNFEALNSASSS
ncbi:uncharacterized protein LOC129227692 isoform X2 [Uloborus diversus]|uniref:uncharacterized protein LOC129227692 isoform X2 n=1 Tax=Uloborus diversus TaxID=327109 RepID=UPI002409032E|nr:uncharacterized protein LOC129227692 isoform X2 [Uloborus diversus]